MGGGSWAKIVVALCPPLRTAQYHTRSLATFELRWANMVSLNSVCELVYVYVGAQHFQWGVAFIVICFCCPTVLLQNKIQVPQRRSRRDGAGIWVGGRANLTCGDEALVEEHNTKRQNIHHHHHQTSLITTAKRLRWWRMCCKCYDITLIPTWVFHRYNYSGSSRSAVLPLSRY